MKIKKVDCWFPDLLSRTTFEVGGRMPHSDDYSVTIKTIELTPTGGVVVEASGGVLKLIANAPMIIDFIASEEEAVVESEVEQE